MTDTARDRITQVIEDNYSCTRGAEVDNASEIAADIITALIDGVPDLVWCGVAANAGNGCYYQMLESHTGKSFQLTFVFRGGSHSLGYPRNADEAKAAANAHNRETWAKMGGLLA